MKVVISGSTGMVGRAVSEALLRRGDQVRYLTRGTTSRADDIRWDPQRQQMDLRGLEGCDAVIHLAGENIAARRWTAEQKRRILDSRVSGTRLLAQTLAGLQHPPEVLLCASAVGFYGHRGDQPLTEKSAPGTGFLSEVCAAWEAAADAARRRGIRVLSLRFGIVLSRGGGVLARMLLPFRLGLGGRVGDGTQYMSWISIDDAMEAMTWLLAAGITGPVNLVAPAPVTNADFTRALGRVLHRPTPFRVPAFAARLALGEMADSLLLASTRVLPERLLDAGFRFRHADLAAALAAILQPRNTRNARNK
jgi:uncharacterized protein